MLHAEYLLSERSQYGAGTERGPLTRASLFDELNLPATLWLAGPTPVNIPAEIPAHSWRHPSRSLAALAEQLQRAPEVPERRRATMSSMRTSTTVTAGGHYATPEGRTRADSCAFAVHQELRCGRPSLTDGHGRPAACVDQPVWTWVASLSVCVRNRKLRARGEGMGGCAPLTLQVRSVPCLDYVPSLFSPVTSSPLV